MDRAARTLRIEDEIGCDPLDGPTTLALAFASRATMSDPRAWAALQTAFPTSVIAGCTTAGQIDGSRVTDDGILVGVARFDTTRLRRCVVAVPSAEKSERIGQELGARLIGPDLRAAIVLSDGTQVNGSALVSGLTSALPADVVVTGGLAADGDRFEKTMVLGPDGPEQGIVTAVGLYGTDLHVRSGSQGGWDLFGPERRITRSQGNILFELDDAPALDLYKRYLGDLATELPGSALLFPLAIRPTDSDEQPVVRTILGVDEDQRTLTFAGDMPNGWRAQLMRANLDRLVDGANEAAEVATDIGQIRDPFVIGVSCVGRRLVLGERTDEELEAVVQALAPEATFVGFYSYGELAPGSTGSCELHNQTMTLTVIGES